MINNLFTCPVYESQLDLDAKAISLNCLDIKHKSNGVIKSNLTGWQSSNVQDKINIVEKTLSIENMWININNYKDYNIEHTHPGSILSGVYYSQVSDNSGNLVFIHPAKDVMVYDWDNCDWQEYNKYSSSWWFTPSINKLFLFPSWLKHYVMPNLNQEERISISFNII